MISFFGNKVDKLKIDGVAVSDMLIQLTADITD
jgi:hypothetical protein